MTDERVREEFSSQVGEVDLEHQLPAAGSVPPRVLPDARPRAAGRWKQWGNTALDRADEYRRPVADALDSLGQRLEDLTGRVPNRPEAARYGRMAAGRMHGAAGYLRDHEAREMSSAVGQYANEKPGVALAVAAVGGYFAARLLKGIFGRKRRYV